MGNELDKPIGTIDKPKLSVGSIKVEKISIVEKPTKKGGKVKLVEFLCKHQDQEKPIAISNLKLKKVQGNNETISVDGIWYREDDKEEIDKNCNAALIMKHYKKSTLKSFENTFVDTETTASGYLAIKTY